MADLKKCAHEGCTCIVAEGETYCSEICKDSTGVTQISCDCKHPGCGGEIV